MAMEFKQLAQVTVANAAGSVYQNPASTLAQIQQINFFNYGVNIETIILYHDDDGTGVLDINRVDQITLNPGQSGRMVDLKINQGKAAQGNISMVTTTAASVTATLYGFEKTGP